MIKRLSMMGIFSFRKDDVKITDEPPAVRRTEAVHLTKDIRFIFTTLEIHYF
jgi:hypothetical protein